MVKLILSAIALLLLGADYSGTWRTTDGQRGKVVCKLTRQGDGKWLAVFVDQTNGRRYAVKLSGELPKLFNRQAVLSGEAYEFQATLLPDGTFTATWQGGRYPGGFKMKEKE